MIIVVVLLWGECGGGDGSIVTVVVIGVSLVVCNGDVLIMTI